MSNRRCDECVYWRKQGALSSHRDDARGKCYRFPPVLDVHALEGEDTECDGSEVNLTAWKQPLTTGYDWCGEFSSTQDEQI